MCCQKIHLTRSTKGKFSGSKQVTKGTSNPKKKGKSTMDSVKGNYVIIRNKINVYFPPSFLPNLKSNCKKQYVCNCIYVTYNINIQNYKCSIYTHNYIDIQQKYTVGPITYRNIMYLSIVALRR